MTSSQSDVLILGATGQVGFALTQSDWSGISVRGCDRMEADLRQPEQLRDLIGDLRPRIVINAAADTAVDRAETEVEAARVVNATAPEVMAQTCREIGARLVHYSTDYVFDGEADVPYQESDLTGPVNTYGQIKREGEVDVLVASSQHLVFRLSWVYSTRGRNFALTMLRLAREGRPIRVVDDQIGSPTYARAIASLTRDICVQLLDQPEAPGGLFHMTAGGQTSWCGFAQALLTAMLGEAAPHVEPIPTSAFPTPARRPQFSVLDNAKIEARFGARLPDWTEQLAQWAADMPVA